jgi:hypothetical protein
MGIYQDLYVKRYFVGAKLENLCAVAAEALALAFVFTSPLYSRGYVKLGFSLLALGFRIGKSRASLPIPLSWRLHPE